MGSLPLYHLGSPHPLRTQLLPKFQTLRGADIKPCVAQWALLNRIDSKLWAPRSQLPAKGWPCGWGFLAELSEVSYVIFFYLLYSVQFSRSVMSNSLRPHGVQHARPPCPSPTPGIYSSSWPLSQWCHPTISSSVVPFSSCPQSFPASWSFQMSQFFPSGGQSIGVSASVLPRNIQHGFPLGWTGWISLQSKGLSSIFLLKGMIFLKLCTSD